MFDQEASSASNALDDVARNAKLKDLPADCGFGDGGAYGLIAEASTSSSSSSKPLVLNHEESAFGDAASISESKTKAASSSSSGKLKSTFKRKREVVELQDEVSFVSMLSEQERIFAVGSHGCVAQTVRGVTVDSTRTVVEIFEDHTLFDKVGYISTAEPLGRTNGLKATCSRHRAKGEKACQCWIAYGKSKVLTPEERLDLFKSLCEWVAEGKHTSREEHAESSLNLRIGAGMKPRAPKK